MKQKCMFFWKSFAFSMIQWMLAIWSLFPLSFLNPAFYIWKFLAHVLLKPSLKGFEYYLASIWDKCNCVVFWIFSDIALLWDWNENWPFSSPVANAVFQMCYHNECSTLIASSFRIWNSSTGISSPPLALFIEMLPKVYLTSHPRMSGSRWVNTLLLRPLYIENKVLTLNLFLTIKKYTCMI